MLLVSLYDKHRAIVVPAVPLISAVVASLFPPADLRFDVDGAHSCEISG